MRQRFTGLYTPRKMYRVNAWGKERVIEIMAVWFALLVWWFLILPFALHSPTPGQAWSDLEMKVERAEAESRR